MDKGDKMKRTVLSIGQVIICFLEYVNLICLTFSFPRTIFRIYVVLLLMENGSNRSISFFAPQCATSTETNCSLLSSPG